MGPEEIDLSSKCRITDAAAFFRRTDTFKTIQIKGSPETYSM
jgi:hypothetical protein